MKIEEAAQWLNEDIKECESDRGKYKGSPFKEGIERRKELYIIALSAVEKQIPKAVIAHEQIRDGKTTRIDLECPVCGFWQDERHIKSYCPMCGQRLK
jgi:rubrerythrin